MAIKLNPTFATYYYNRGNSKIKIKDYLGAIEDFSKTVEINSSHTNAFYNRGVIKIIIGQKESALSDLRCAEAHGLVKASETIKNYFN
jgi:tetratricopeptide (TPR) repeat protein